MKCFRSLSVCFDCLGVLPAIYFYGQVAGWDGEIHYIIADRVLSPNLVRKADRAERIPKFPLGVGH